VSKKQMLLVTGSNVMVNTDLDALVSLIGDEWETTAYESGMLAQVPEFDAVMVSLTSGLSDRELAQVMRAARPGYVFVKQVDVQYGTSLSTAFRAVPVTAIATLHPSIIDTPADAELRKRWMGQLHPDSRLVYAEFLAGLVHTIGSDIEQVAERARAKPAPDPAIRSFYWGIRRPGVVESLRSLGFGADKRDAVFGAVAGQFRAVRDVSRGLSRAERFEMDSWAHYAAHAERVLLPYERIKSEYQITRRLLECAHLAPETTVADPRLSEHVVRFLDPAEWAAYAKEVSADLLDVLDKGLPSVTAAAKLASADWSEYGLQVGTKHGELLRWVLANVDLTEGWAVEFGTGDGTSTRAIAEHVPVMTFDCMTGLPEEWRPGFGKGMFAQRHVPNVPGSVFVNGLFEDTLPGAPLPSRVALLHIDCDLYASTATIFERARDLIQPGTVIVFDELIAYPGWEQHEHRAWTELREVWPTLQVEPIGWAHEAVAYRVTGI